MSNETNTRTVKIHQKLASVFEPAQAEVLSEVVTEAFQDLVKTSDFSELKAVVGELAQAQHRTELRVEELSQAQHRTELRVEELSQAQHRTELRIEELAEAQKQTDESLKELATAQKRTEQRMDKLAEAQAQTDESMKKMAAAQAETEKSMKDLTKAMAQLSRQVGGLSDRMGGDIEDVAQFMVSQMLQNELGWQVKDLERSWQTWGAEPEEIDLFGEAHDPTRPDVKIFIVGEAKFNLTIKEAQKFNHQIKRAQAHISDQVFPVCFCYRARPEVQEFLAENQIHLVFSYGKLILNEGIWNIQSPNL